ncbi:MAG TPA: threonine synthase [Candidatus Binatia bacterium]|nr:threonine synthase [Candidatus Binatia bacterium]
MTLSCSECGAVAKKGDVFCAACNGLLEFSAPEAGKPARALKALFAERQSATTLRGRSGVWRFRELLPPIAEDAIVTLGENQVPVYAAPRGARYAGLARAAYLHLGMNPTASFKDAGMTVAVSQAHAAGARLAACASTGNTAASMAAYCARAEMRALVLVPATGISESKVVQTLDYGADVVALDGDFDAALAMVRKLDPARVAIVNSVNPYRIEGQKCAAFVLLEQREWRAPDWLVLPGGNLGNSSAFGKGFREAVALGLADRVPRIAVVQAAGAAPFYKAFTTGQELVPVSAQTSATAIKIGAPASWKKALREVRSSRGTVTAVSDEEIADARAIVGRDGVGCEPASAASLAGVRKLVAEGTILPGDDVVIVLTGHVLKDTAYAAEYHRSGAQFANRIGAAHSEAELLARIETLVTARV